MLYEIYLVVDLPYTIPKGQHMRILNGAIINMVDQIAVKISTLIIGGREIVSLPFLIPPVTVNIIYINGFIKAKLTFLL
jgi:hypothetical protein